MYVALPVVNAGVHSNTNEYIEPSNKDWINPRQNTLGSEKKKKKKKNYIYIYTKTPH